MTYKEKLCLTQNPKNMKRKIPLLTLLFVTIALNLHAGKWTVSNNPGSPGQYTSLQAAIDAAGSNDTIMVAGSATSYGTITFGKPLVLVGAGYNNPYGQNSTIDQITLTRQNLYISASGSKIMGFNVTSNIYLNGIFTGGVDSTRTINNSVFERCNINIIWFGQGGYNQTFKNDTIRNCLIQGNFYMYGQNGTISYFKNIVIQNNIFSSTNTAGNAYLYCASSYISDLSFCYLRNNIFLNHVSNCFNNIKNMIIENNIFYGAEPLGGTTCVYNNNITYMCVNNSIPGVGNLGSGNLVNTDPQFVSFPVVGGTFSYSYDVHLKPSSPGKTGGTGGTEIGVYGGTKPYEPGANPAFPQMMEISFPNGSSVATGGVLDVYFKARKQQ